VSLGGKIADQATQDFNNMPDRSKILPLGYPRNDHLFNTPKKKKGLFTNIIYMPTFKQSQNQTYSEEYLQNETGLALFENRKDLLKIDKWLKSEGINVHLKLHRLQKNLEIYGWIPYNLTNFKIIRNSDLSEDFYLSLQYYDALLTDYSSIAIDWLALDRPEGFIFTDLSDYERSRGQFCCDPIKYSAGHHIYSMDDFKAFCTDVKNGVDTYSEKRKFVKNSFFKNPDGNSAERIYQFIKKLLK
jgi:CDP-glycerol glycerophosphotransferase